MESLKELQKDEATAKIGTGSATIKYYREARAALSYPPVMTLDTGTEYPTSHIIQTGDGDRHTLTPKTPTPIPMPDDLRPSSDDWQPIAEVLPRSTAIDCGGFSYPTPQGGTEVTQPKTVQVAWDGAIECHLCRLPYAPLTSWPWRWWFGNTGRLPMYIDGVGGVTYHPQEGDVCDLDAYTGDDVLFEPAAFPMVSGGVTINGVTRTAGGIISASLFADAQTGKSGLVKTYAAGGSSVSLNYIVTASNRHWLEMTLENRDGMPAVTHGYSVGLLVNGAAMAGAMAITSAAQPDTVNYWRWRSIKGTLRTMQPLGYKIIVPNCEYPIDAVAWFSISATIPTGATSATASKLRVTFVHNKLGFPVMVAAADTTSAAPPVTETTGTVTPLVFKVGGDADRSAILSDPARRGYITGMILPNCAYDIILHWWSEDGKSYALPFKAVEVERSASVVSETRRDIMADDLLSSRREQYSTMRGESLTRYRCAMELDEEEQKTAATMAQSPFFCYTLASEEDGEEAPTRHWCEVDGVRTEWSGTEASTIEITIKDI